MYPRHLYLASLSLASKCVPWSRRYLPGGLGLGETVGPFGRFVRMEDFFGLKNEGAGIFGTQPQEMGGLEWKMRFSI